MKPGRAPCVDCHEAHAAFSEGPPCHECNKPADLTPEGETALLLWRELHGRERPYWQADGMPLPLPLASVRAMVQDYGLSLEMQEMVLVLDDHVTVMLQEKHAREKGVNKKAG